MKHLFGFVEEKDTYHVLKLVAKVFKVFGYITACVSALIILIQSAQANYAPGILLGVIVAAVAFFLSLFSGMVSEVFFLGLAVMTKNNAQQIKERGMSDDNDNMDVLEKIRKLGNLKNDGIISEEEYQNKKRSLLNEI